MTAPLVKICGLTRRADAEAAAAAGASYGGVILAEGRTRSVRAADARELFRGLRLRRVGVFVDAALESVVAAAEAAELDVVQLHGEEDPEYVRALRERGPWRVWKAIRPQTGNDFDAGVRRFGVLPHGLLLDGWSAAAEGGTGTSFPWEQVSARLDSFPPALELIVAGGLRPENVARAVSLLSPAVVDVSSGVEARPGEKSPELIRAFVTAARRPSSGFARSA